MREILFRAKDNTYSKNHGEWLYGVPFLDDNGDLVMSSSDYKCYKLFVKKETVGEYTGITDKKGNKIFEGDVFHIEKENYYGVVRYGRYCNPFNDDPDKRHVGFYVEWNNRPELLRRDLAFWSYECEIVGNIFDNPDLVKKGDEQCQ